jgi:hypothetical protein
VKRFFARFAVVAVASAICLPGLAGASRSNPGPESAGGRCTGRPFELVKVSTLHDGEQTRAEKVDRNGNGFVCRMDIPGRGQGNTGQNSNIKDDKI